LALPRSRVRFSRAPARSLRKNALPRSKMGVEPFFPSPHPTPLTFETACLSL